MPVAEEHKDDCFDIELGPRGDDDDKNTSVPPKSVYKPEKSGTEESQPKPAIEPFAGRIGGFQSLEIDRADPKNAEILKKVPDAAPFMTFKEGFDLRGFSDINLWKFGVAECVGTMMLSFITIWISAHPFAASSMPPTTTAGIYGTPTFLGPLVGGITNWLLLSLFIISFSNVSGGHLNPTITLGTFFARLISFPRMVIYLLNQILGGTLAGLVSRAAYGSREYIAGGCYVDTTLVPVEDAFVLEFMFCLILLFLAFGVALDPRQSKVTGAAAAPWLVGMVLGVISWGSSFTRSGYSGASLNPARCFGTYVGSYFPSYHWIHWVGPIAASIGHGIMYSIVPPWSAMHGVTEHGA